MAATVLPQVAGALPPAAPASSARHTSQLPKLPSICSSTPATCEETPAKEVVGEHAAFVANYGSMINETGEVFQAHARELVKTFKFFQGLDPGVQSQLPEVIGTMSKREGAVLFREGDSPGNCYIVLKGEAAIFIRTEEDQPDPDAEDTPRGRGCGGIKTVEGFSSYSDDSNFGTQIGVLGPGTLVGELALVNDQPRSATVRLTADTDFLVIRRTDFDNLLKEDMVRKGDEKLRFLMGHVPGMKQTAVPKSGVKTPHACYYFNKAAFPRGHHFLREGLVAEPCIIILFKGAAEVRRSEHAPQGVGAALPSSLSTPVLHEQLPGGMMLGTYRRAPGVMERCNFQARLKSLARVPDCDETVNRLGVLVPGGIFGSLPFQDKEPFTVTVTSPMCEVFMCSGSDLTKLPRRLLESIREHLAHSAAYRLQQHQRAQDLRRNRPPDKTVKKRRGLIRISSSPVI